ncbi:MAG: aminotransferase class III-fold pyridoxal phosphate-dependent enzyme [Gammaproteobacteria bacterium]|jgi:beta-alanine--pyruvate transaminase
MDTQLVNQDALDSELESIWLPYTANRTFKQKPRIIESAKGFYYKTAEGRSVMDSFSGLWTTGLGHCHPNIVDAVQQQVAKLDYSMGFQIANSTAIVAANKLMATAPDTFNKVFFTNSGSEAVDTALKIALGYHKLKGDDTRARFVGREKGYHGCNFGGTSVGGIPANRELFKGGLLPNVDHLPHTLNHEHKKFSKGQPSTGAHLADDLQRIVNLRGAENIAAVIVEPVSGSSGVIVPPVGYLERLREICTQHGILLIFDEVITAFYRIGTPFGCQRFNVMPDIITTAKGITNGVIPMGAVLVHDDIYNTYMQGTDEGIELFHGYTYSGHPVAAAAAVASLDIYAQEDISSQAVKLEPLFEAAIHALCDAQHVIDIRNFGLMGAIELAPRDGAPGARGMEAHIKCFENGLMIRNGMDTLQFAPFFSSSVDVIEQTFATLRKVLESID